MTPGPTITIMSDEPPNLVLEHLRAIGEDLGEIREEQREQRGRLGSIERGISHMSGEIAQIGLRLDRMHDRLDRIDRRLDLVEA
jgi:tetrahydromethanopterin S-methyltransferase subunit G